MHLALILAGLAEGPRVASSPVSHGLGSNLP